MALCVVRGHLEVVVIQISSAESKLFESYSGMKLEDAGCSYGRRRRAGDMAEGGRSLSSVEGCLTDVC